MLKHLERSRDLFLANQTEGFHLGVELTTLPKSQYDFALKHPSDPDRRDQWLRGYIPPVFKKNGIALSLSEEEINRCKVEICSGRGALVIWIASEQKGCN